MRNVCPEDTRVGCAVVGYETSFIIVVPSKSRSPIPPYLSPPSKHQEHGTIKILLPPPPPNPLPRPHPPRRRRLRRIHHRDLRGGPDEQENGEEKYDGHEGWDEGWYEGDGG